MFTGFLIIILLLFMLNLMKNTHIKIIFCTLFFAFSALSFNLDVLKEYFQDIQFKISGHMAVLKSPIGAAAGAQQAQDEALLWLLRDVRGGIQILEQMQTAATEEQRDEVSGLQGCFVNRLRADVRPVVERLSGQRVKNASTLLGIIDEFLGGAQGASVAAVCTLSTGLPSDDLASFLEAYHEQVFVVCGNIMGLEGSAAQSKKELENLRSAVFEAEAQLSEKFRTGAIAAKINQVFKHEIHPQLEECEKTLRANQKKSWSGATQETSSANQSVQKLQRMQLTPDTLRVPSLRGTMTPSGSLVHGALESRLQGKGSKSFSPEFVQFVQEWTSEQGGNLFFSVLADSYAKGFTILASSSDRSSGGAIEALLTGFGHDAGSEPREVIKKIAADIARKMAHELSTERRQKIQQNADKLGGWIAAEAAKHKEKVVAGAQEAATGAVVRISEGALAGGTLGGPAGAVLGAVAGLFAPQAKTFLSETVGGKVKQMGGAALQKGAAMIGAQVSQPMEIKWQEGIYYFASHFVPPMVKKAEEGMAISLLIEANKAADWKPAQLSLDGVNFFTRKMDLANAEFALELLSVLAVENALNAIADVAQARNQGSDAVRAIYAARGSTQEDVNQSVSGLQQSLLRYLLAENGRGDVPPVGYAEQVRTILARVMRELKEEMSEARAEWNQIFSQRR